MVYPVAVSTCLPVSTPLYKFFPFHTILFILELIFSRKLITNLKTMAKFITFFMLTLLLSSALVFAGRPDPQPHIAGKQNLGADKVVDETCGGVGEEECLMRRTLVAHLDYIYTQEHHE